MPCYKAVVVFTGLILAGTGLALICVNMAADAWVERMGLLKRAKKEGAVMFVNRNVTAHQNPDNETVVELEIRNVGAIPATIKSASGCGCTVVGLEKNELKPNESMKCTVSFAPNSKHENRYETVAMENLAGKPRYFFAFVKLY
ncbi:MAG: DUF1573 domain-containing protein [Chthonomonadaceae bacterium]|nr:DUF1573 domain-containing protein [Chthonomonadaceae bacterium]